MKRYTKFYLNYWVVFLIFVPVGVFCFNRPLTIPYGEDANIPLALLKDFFGLQKYNSYNITWWFNQIIVILWLVFPIMFWMVKNKITRCLFLPFCMFFMPINGVAFLLGIYLAQYRALVEKLLLLLSEKVCLCLLIVCFLGLCFCRENMAFSCLASINADPYIAVCLTCLIAMITHKINYRMPVLSYLGKHSMNIYLIHTFIFKYFFHDFIYGLHNCILMFVVLMLTALGISIILETFKIKMFFYAFVGKITAKLSV